MNAEQHVPQFRFKGFSDSWEQHKLSDGTNKIGDGLHGTPKYSEDGDVYFVNGNNLVNGQIVITSETKRVTSNEQSKDDKALNENTILMSINGTIGNLAWYRGENLMLGKSAAYIEVSDFDKKFIYTYLQTRPVKDYYLNSLTGTTIKNLGLKAIRNTNIYTPTIDEQAKIGVLFQNLDMTITLHQRKLAKLKELKKGYLQKLFPQNSEKVPEFRFKGYSDAWEKRKLLGLTEKIIDFRGRTPRKLNMHWSDSGYLALSALNVKMGYIDQNADAHFGNEILYQKWMGNSELQTGDVILTTEAPLGNVFLVGAETKFILSQRTIALRTNKSQLNPQFLAVLLSSPIMQTNLRKLSTGGTALGISQKNLKFLVINLPTNILEQQAIGSTLMELDSLIAATQCKLDLLKKLKKGYLQKMFC